MISSNMTVLLGIQHSLNLLGNSSCYSFADLSAMFLVCGKSLMEVIGIGSVSGCYSARCFMNLFAMNTVL